MWKNIDKKPFKVALIAALSALVGFCSIYLFFIFIDPSIRHLEYWGFALLGLAYFIISGQIFIGIILSFLIGAVSYLFFWILIKKGVSKNILKWSIVFISIAALIIGFLAYFPAQTFVFERDFGKEKIWESDENGDGRTDKWIHQDVHYSVTKTDIDSDFDGKPDIWKYYKDSKVIRKEIDSDFDGKPDKIENFK